MTLENPSKSLAFFVRLKVNKGKGGDEILPVIWQDNYVSLLPGEKREITATYRAQNSERRSRQWKSAGGMLSDAEARELTGVTDHWDMKTGFARRRYQQARARYVPRRTRVLFVAEAPPLSLERYFYFEDVRNGDWLWIALMKELFPCGMGRDE